MKKHISISLLLALGLNANTTAEQKTIESLIKQVNNLQKEVDTLKKNNQENSDAIEEISDFTEGIEAKSFKDKIDFGLGFITNLDNFNKKYADGHKVKSNNVWSNKLMLKMRAEITKDMKFYGRLSMYKYWGSSSVHPYTYYDNMQGRVPADSSIYVERAYINWFFLKDSYLPLAITLGRQPSSDGPSNQYKNNSARKGTYSALLYDGAADGAVFTADISKLINNQQSYLRVGYAKGYGHTESSPYAGNAFIGPSNNDIKDTNVFGVFFDTTVPNMQETLIQISYSKMIDIIANPLDTDTTQNKNIGDVDMLGAMIELSNIKDSNLDLFAHYGHSIANLNANSYANFGGLLSKAGDTSTKSGDGFWLGSRYGFGEREKYKIGLEYNHGSKNWINLTQGSFDIYNKLSTRGNAYEAYAMYVINRYANIRLGYVNIDYNYTGSGWFVGESKKITSDMPYADSTVSQLQSVYLKMNVYF
jgi:hypothetical protein